MSPAGFGKSTLLGEFVVQLQQAVAWVSLDEGDNDPVRFWSYLIAACQSVRPGMGESALELLKSSQPLPDDAIPSSLPSSKSRRTTTARPAAMTRMASSLYAPEARVAKSPPPAFATSWRVMSGAKAGSPITPKSIIRISRPFFSINSLEWPIIDLCLRQF